MTLDVDSETRAQVERLVHSGAFPTADAVITAGLRLIEAQRSARDRLSAGIDEGLAELERGEGLDGEAVFRELYKRIANSKAATDSGT